MEDGSSRGSAISLLESEPSVDPKNIKQDSSSNNANRILTHKYNTRYSVKLKKLFVDLNSTSTDFNSNAVSYRKNRRDSDTFSEDSRLFNNYNSSFIDTIRTINLMDEPRVCQQNSWKTWKKYGIAFFALGLLYIYLQVIHTGESVRKLHKEIDSLKTDLLNTQSTSRIKKIENTLDYMRRHQENHNKNVYDIVSKEMEKYSADKTGRTDFALETTGGKIISLTQGTENFDNAKTLFGLTLCEGIHGPRAMLQSDMSPGHCWAFKGSHGGAIIKLMGQVQIKAVTLEHISESVSPTGEISSAPKEFTVWGRTSSTDRGESLGNFIYHKSGPLVQTFPIASSKFYEYVEFKVMSNHGNPDYTCIYRFRVHGKLQWDKGL